MHLASAVAPNIDRHTQIVCPFIYLSGDIILYMCFLKHNVYTALCSDKTRQVVIVHYVLGLSSTFSKDLGIMVENGKPVINLGTLNMCNTNLKA